jgi:hypothetical protein
MLDRYVIFSLGVPTIPETDEPKRGVRLGIRHLPLQGSDPLAQDLGLGSGQSIGQSLQSGVFVGSEIDLYRGRL